MNHPPLRLFLLGKNGRMGKTVQNWIAKNDSGIALCDSVAEAKIILDFSSPAAVLELAKTEALSGTQGWVIGSTGWTAEQQQERDQLLKERATVVAPNFSLGIALLQECLKVASKLSHSSVEVFEAHHIHKKDRPSGTAVAIINTLHSLGVPHPHVETVRSGEIIGDHRVEFKNSSESLTLTHHAVSRDLFAEGAIHVCRWLENQIRIKPTFSGRFSIADTLNRSI